MRTQPNRNGFKIETWPKTHLLVHRKKGQNCAIGGKYAMESKKWRGNCVFASQSGSDVYCFLRRFTLLKDTGYATLNLKNPRTFLEQVIGSTVAAAPRPCHRCPQVV